MNKIADIFVYSHKNVKIDLKNKVYKALYNCDNVKTSLTKVKEGDTEITPIERSYGEGSGIYWVYKHKRLKKYVGFCHYRRFFSFYDDVPNLDDIFANHDAILANYIHVDSCINNYGTCHDRNDLLKIGSIVKDYYPEYFNAFLTMCSSDYLFPCNMFIMKKEDFKEFCGFAFGVLNKFSELNNLYTMDDIEDYVNKNKENYVIDRGESFTSYQSRLFGFILERLLNVYVRYKFKRICMFPIIQTE